MSLLRWIPPWLLLFATMQAPAETFTPAPELWDRPRSGRAVLSEPAVRGAVNAYLARPGARLVIRHPPGTTAVLQAEEIRGWLTALAVESNDVGLKSDASIQTLTIEVTTER